MGSWVTEVLEKGDFVIVPHQKAVTISVIGGHAIDEKIAAKAEQIGRMIAQVKAVLVCGGLDGVMEAAARGARQAGGLTIGLLPGVDKRDANEHIAIALPTSIGYARNTIVAVSADIIVALEGSFGTNSEICYGRVHRRPVIDCGGWNIPGMIPVKRIEKLPEVLDALIKMIRAESSESMGS